MTASSEASLELLASLVRAQRDGEHAVQGLIAERLEAAGCEVRAHEYDPAEVPIVGEFASDGSRDPERRTAIVATLPGDVARRSLLMFAHPDSEPPSAAGSADGPDSVGPRSWRHDPFAAEIDAGRMYGWGIADDLAGCAAAMLAIEHVARDAPDGRGVLTFASTPSKRYARGVAALLHSGLGADASLYLHPAESGIGMREIKAVASGQLEFRIVVRGRLPDTTEPGHTAFSHLATNPVDLAFLVHRALAELAGTRASRVRHALIEARVGRATNLHVSSLHCGTMTKLSRLVETCTLGGAVSFPPTERLDDVRAELERALERCVSADERLRADPPRIEWLSGVTGGEVAATHPLFVTASEAVRRVTGDAPHVNPMHTSSDIRHPIVEAGIPTVGLGCLGGDLTQNGRVDEWIDVADFGRMVEVCAGVARDWCTAPAARRA